MRKNLTGCVTIALTLIFASARAQELDSLLPGSIPGYAKPFGVTDSNQPRRIQASGFMLGDVALLPALGLTQGYDSAPNGAAGSAVSAASPSLLVTDKLLGFGAFAAANAASYPQNTTQNTSGVTLAAGERVLLPGEAVTLSAGYLRAQETGFALDTIAIARPIAFTVSDVRASDEITAGMFMLKPEFSTTEYRFPGLAAQNRIDDREDLTSTYIPGGPIEVLFRLRATQSAYRETIFNADTNQVLTGVEDTANGLWTFSALAGAAQRRPRYGLSTTAPVLEAGLDWMPGDLDRVRMTLAHEIDDPDRVSATPYMLTDVKISITHEYLTNIVFKLAAQASNAAYMHSPLRETLFNSDVKVSWQIGAGLAVDGDYIFNDRQANYLRAANEHVATLGVVWTP